MDLKKVWMSPNTSQKCHYARRTLGSIVGIVVLMLLLICGGTLLSFYMSWPRELFSIILCLGVTLLAVYLAAMVGRRSVQDATAFFLTENDRLYIMDARRLSDYRHGGIWGYTTGTLETQRFLKKMAEEPFLPAGADEILKVERVKENGSHYTVRCQIRHPNRHVVKRTYLLVKGYEEEEYLLQQLERRKTWEDALEPVENRNPLYMMISIVLFVVFTTLCAMSHPVLAKLPENLYFPCLGADFIVFCCMVYFIIRQRRGE